MTHPSEEERTIAITVNGMSVLGKAEPRMLLSDFIREELGLTGTHVGCEQGACGACTVVLDGRPTRSCIMFAVQVDGAQLETVEGLAGGAELTPLQDAFRKHHGLQCGFCTPGMLMAATTLLEAHEDPTEVEIREYMSGNICRCTGYVGIVAAVREAAARRRSDSSVGSLPEEAA